MGWLFQGKGTGRKHIVKVRSPSREKPKPGMFPNWDSVYLPIVLFLTPACITWALNSETLDTGFFFFLSSLDDSNVQPRLRIIAWLQWSCCCRLTKRKRKLLCFGHKCQLQESLAEHELQPCKVTCKNYQHTNGHFSIPSFARFNYRDRYWSILLC